MPVDRKLFSERITEHSSPSWPCPRCSRGHYRLDRRTFKFFNTADSAVAQARSPDFDPADYSFRFAATPACDNPECAEKAVIAGSGLVELVEYQNDESYDADWMNIFDIEYFSPTPALILLPKQCPKSVKHELELAFFAFWSDLSSAGNHIRSGIERMMDDLGVSKSKLVRRRMVRLSLHERLKKIASKYPEAQEALMAIKWLGNAGSHSDVLTHKAVFDALDMFEIAMEHVYVKHHAAMKKLAKAVNKKKGPIAAAARRGSGR